MIPAGDEGVQMTTIARYRRPSLAHAKFFVCALLGLALAGPGCQSGSSQAFTPDSNTFFAEDRESRLEPGDIIDVKFYKNPELNDTATIDPDGNIYLQIVGEVKAKDKSMTQLKNELEKLYAGEVREPRITISPRTLASRQVYVGGEVGKPGPVAIPGKITLLEAIMHAGGYNPVTAEISNVVVIRHDESQTSHQGVLVDLKSVLAGEQSRQFMLKPRDVVFVPRNKISEVNTWIDQYINKLIPRFGVVYGRPVGDGSISVDTTASRP